MIYETKGRAREYFELAANLYVGCAHGCRYCYAPDVLHMKPELFFNGGRPKPQVLERLKKSAEQFRGDPRPVLLSFISDAYQPAEESAGVTREAIQIIHAAGLKVAILTKGGFRATRDFDLLGPEDIFGTTLTFEDPELSKQWEPLAAPPQERFGSLVLAKRKGIKTFVSLEPVIVMSETFKCIDKTAPFVDQFKVGKLNYMEAARTLDWNAFARAVIQKLDENGAKYYIKRDLAAYIGKPDGILKGGEL
jgi:DNA repair photolyase